MTHRFHIHHLLLLVLVLVPHTASAAESKTAIIEPSCLDKALALPQGSDPFALLPEECFVKKTDSGDSPGHGFEKIIGGTEVESNDFPFVGFIGYAGVPEREGHFCGAVLIGPRTALTAAHCVNYWSSTTASWSEYSVYFGSQDMDNGQSEVGKIEKVVGAGFLPKTLENDLVAVILREPVTTTPVPLVPKGDPDNLAGPGSEITILGWGRNENCARPTRLRKVTLTAVSGEEAEQLLPPFKVPQTMIAARDTSSIAGSYFGDSGGPWLVKNSTGDYLLAGIVSWGQSDHSRPGYVSGATRISEFSDFIHEHAAFKFIFQLDVWSPFHVLGNYNTPVYGRFTGNVDPDDINEDMYSVSQMDIYGNYHKVDGTAFFDEKTDTLLYRPSEEYVPEMPVRFSVGEVRSTDGSVFSGMNRYGTPRLPARTAPVNCTIANTPYPGGDIKLLCTAEMDNFSLNKDGNVVLVDTETSEEIEVQVHNVFGDKDFTLYIVPDELKLGGNYELRLGDVTDIYGNPVTEHVFPFQSSKGTSVLSMIPEDGAVNCSLKPDVRLHVSPPYSAAPCGLKLKKTATGEDIPVALLYTSGGGYFIMLHYHDLEPLTEYEVRHWSDGSFWEEDTVWHFTTGEGAVAPSIVSSLSPAGWTVLCLLLSVAGFFLLKRKHRIMK